MSASCPRASRKDNAQMAEFVCPVRATTRPEGLHLLHQVISAPCFAEYTGMDPIAGTKGSSIGLHLRSGYTPLRGALRRAHEIVPHRSARLASGVGRGPQIPEAVR